LATRRIDIEGPDQVRTEKIDTEQVQPTATDVVLRDPGFDDEDTEIDATMLSTVHIRARGVFERLDRAGVQARSDASGSVRAGRNRRIDRETAQRFDHAYKLLSEGDLEGAFFGFTELLERRPESTRLWIFVRALTQARSAGE
jgi:hypothetical protein